MSADLQLLRDLCLAPAPTGFEGPVLDVVRRRLARLGPVQGDPLGNVWLDAGPAGGPQIVAVAHADQIGLIVTHVDERGFLTVDRIGGVASVLVPGRHLVVHDPRGDVHAVSGGKPTHIIPEKDRDKAPELSEQFLDIGATSREDALARVAVGDAVTFAPDFVELSSGIVATQAIDDRAGVYTVIRALELYAAAPGKAVLTGVASVHEETTYMGAKALARRLDPAVVIAIDGDFCSDTPAADAKKLAGEVKLGGGPVLGRGAGSNAAVLALAREVAREEGIDVQIKALPDPCSTDADELMAAGRAATLSLSLPVRSMHSPFEVAHTGDLEASARLIAALAVRIGETWRPNAYLAGLEDAL